MGISLNSGNVIKLLIARVHFILLAFELFEPGGRHQNRGWVLFTDLSVGNCSFISPDNVFLIVIIV